MRSDRLMELLDERGKNKVTHSWRRRASGLP